MKWLRLSVFIALILVLGTMIPAIGAPTAHAQEADIDTLFQIQLEDAELPPSPVFVRLLRITMQPESNSPLHTHPGPEMWRIEAGVVSVRVTGPSTIKRTGDDEPSAAPVNEDFDLVRGDQFTFLPGTPLTFTNKSEEETRILAAVILPAGHQHPPGITYVNGQPPADAFEGIQSDILGDGLADALPSGTTTVTIERVRLAPGAAIPASPSNSLVSVARGSLEFTLDSGRAQVSRTAEPGPQPDASVGTAFTLSRGDAVFFPFGSSEAPRSDRDADITLFRLMITPADEEATPVVPESPAQITVTGPIGEETPEAEVTEPPQEETPEPEATEEPEVEATEEPERVSDLFAVDQTVYVNETDVRLRDAPTTDSNIVVGLTLGQELVITGEAMIGNEIVFWPVTSPVDPLYTGWVAEQFLSPEPIA